MDRPNDTPQIATQGGGVIGASGTTYDQNGKVTGQLASLPAQSWFGNAYTQVGSVAQQVAFTPTNLATSFWAFAQANASSNTTAVKQQWFPPLEHCLNGNTPSCIGPYEAIYNALDDLVARLPAVSALAQTNIFSPLGNDANGNKLTTQRFLHYLTSQRPRFYNGLTSNYCYDSLTSGSTCHENAVLNFLLNNQDVQTVFNDPTVDALTGTPSYPLLTFVRPSVILYNNLGKNLGNEGLIFHEALHGITGQYDRGTVTVPNGILEKLGDSASDPSCMISVTIDNAVLSHSPGLDPTTSSCP